MGTTGNVGGNGSGGATFGNMFATGNSPNLGALLGSTSAQQPRRPGTSGGMFAAGNRAATGAAGGMRGLGPGTGMLGEHIMATLASVAFELESCRPWQLLRAAQSCLQCYLAFRIARHVLACFRSWGAPVPGCFKPACSKGGRCHGC